MNIELIESFIDKWVQVARKMRFSDFIKLSLFMFFITTGYLLAAGGYIPLCFVAVLYVVGFFDVGIKTKKKGRTVYVVIEMGLVFLIYASLLFCAATVGTKLINGTYTALFGIFLLIASIGFVFLGFFHTYHRLKKGKEERFRPSSVSSCLSAAMAGSALSSYLSEKHTESVQEIIYTAIFSLSQFLLMYCIGRFFVAMIFFIKKSGIPDRNI